MPAPSSIAFLDRRALEALGRRHRDAYASARPFPHAVFDGFLAAELARDLAAAFPTPAHPGWKRREHAEQERLGALSRTGFAGVAPVVRHVLGELCGMAFLDFLGALTGEEGLIADPHFSGAGPSITLPGGHLALHADFNRDRRRHLARSATVILYVGDGGAPGWDRAWGGDLELWDRERTQCEVRIAPLPNRLVVLAHGDDFWHGHPSPLACPPERYRASIASYYYVAGGKDEDAHPAIWRA
jgi:hypothetical protein